MKRIAFFTICMVMLSSCMQEMESPVGGKEVTFSFNVNVPASKTALDDTLKWTGEETMTLVFGKLAIGGKDNTSNPTLSSTAPGVFSGTVTIPSGFSISDLQGFVVPGENGAWFDWTGDSSKASADIRMEVPSEQIQKENDIAELSYIPFFYDMKDGDLINNADGSYSLRGGITLRCAADFLRFNVYGKHPDQAEGEVLKSIKIVSTLNGGSKKNITGKTAWPINGTAGVNNTGNDYAKVTLQEAVTIADKTVENGVKVYAAVVFGGKRYIEKIILETDKALYTKTFSPITFNSMNLDKLTIHQIGIDLSNDYIREETANTTRLVIDPEGPLAAMGTSFDSMTDYTLTINGEERKPYKDAEGNWCIGEVTNKDAEALISWNGSDPDFMPFSHFYGQTPKIALKGKLNNAGELVFYDDFALLDLSVRGNGSINSIKVRTLDGSSPAADGVDFVVLNCIRQSGGAVPLQNNFRIPVKPGTYAGGLEITICDSKKLMHRFIADVTELSASEVKKLDVAYAPAADLVYYEGFDNCVWGSDPSGVNKGYGPDDTTPGIVWRTGLSGYENASVEAPAGSAGSGFQLPDSWSSSNTVAKKHSMSESYVKSRDFMGYKYLFRTQEFQGCIGIAPNYQYRGWVETPKLANLTEASLVKLSFRVLSVDGASEDLEFGVLGGGNIIGLSIDSQPVLQSGKEIWSGSASYTIKSSAISSGWHEITYTIDGATAATTFQIRGYQTANTYKHGFFLDDMKVTKIGVAQLEADGISELTSLSTIEASFKLSFNENDVNGITMSLPSGGFICGLKIDSQIIPNSQYNTEKWPLCTAHKISTTDVSAGEHTITYTIESADANTTFTFSGDTESVSEMSIKKVSSIERGNFRLLLWNIQMGMWADQGNNYNNFVTWVKKYNPDCFVITEAETVKKTGSTSNASSSAKYFPNGWKETAARFGHPYAENGGNRDNYSQELTSKTPITTIAKITDTNVSGKPVQHGAGHFRVTVNGKEIDIVTIHTWPQSYAPGASDQAASSAANDGDYYRQHEIKYVIDNTVLNPQYASQKNWIVLGDMNSRSRCDNWFYGYPENSTKLIAQDYIRDNTDLMDVIENKYPGRIIKTCGESRIDYIYVSPALYELLGSAITIRDDWTCLTPTGVSTYQYPSDHRPILVDFNF